MLNYCHFMATSQLTSLQFSDLEKWMRSSLYMSWVLSRSLYSLWLRSSGSMPLALKNSWYATLKAWPMDWAISWAWQRERTKHIASQTFAFAAFHKVHGVTVQHSHLLIQKHGRSSCTGVGRLVLGLCAASLPCLSSPVRCESESSSCEPSVQPCSRCRLCTRWSSVDGPSWCPTKTKMLKVSLCFWTFEHK